MAGQGFAPAIGIDLGTTYSCVAVLQHDQIEIVPNDQGNRITPSCVAFTDNGRLIGEGAQNQIAMNPAYTIFDAKRLIGRRYSDPKVQEDMKLWPFKVIEGSSDIPKIVVSHNGEIKEFSAEEISSMVLTKMKHFAETYLGKTVKDAVITVPAYFDDSQRQATKDAGHVAGLNVLQIINEPTSAAIAYDLNMRKDISHETNVLVFDLGGGTFDVSLVTIDGKGEIKVRAVDGDPHLGGQDFNNKMVEHFITQFNRKHKTNKTIKDNFRAIGKLGIACEKAKRVLSTTTLTSIEIDSVHEGIDFSMSISRAKFEELNVGFFSKCIEKVEKCLSEAKMDKGKVDEVVLVGGSTRIPKVQQLLQEYFKGKDLCKRIHADEAVAYGAAVLAAKLSGEKSKKVKNLVLLDVTPLSLGVRVVGGIMSILIPRNTTIPVKMEKMYETIEDNQSSITFVVYQGERSTAKYNNLLGKFNIPVPLAPRGKSKVKVVFEIDSSGILSCSGKELTTGHTKKIIITDSKGRLSKEEIEKMVKDAEKYSREDREYKKKVRARNDLEKYIYDTRAKIKTRRLPEDKMKKMESAINDASELIDIRRLADVDEYKETLKQLEKLSVSIIP